VLQIVEALGLAHRAHVGSEIVQTDEVDFRVVQSCYRAAGKALRKVDAFHTRNKINPHGCP
jgi:hypothetical protein